MQERKTDKAISEREAEATTDETLSELEEQQEITEGSDTSEIPAPDLPPNRSRESDEEDLM
jgi:hypothetical protein